MAYVASRPSGRFTGYYTDGFGKVRSAGTFDDSAEAQAHAVAHECNSALAPPRKRLRAPKRANTHSLWTYAEYVRTWLEREDGLSPNTLRGYASNLRIHVLPLIGEIPVEQVTIGVISEMITQLRVQGVGAAVQGQCKAAVGRSFQSLVPQRIPTNPTHGVRITIAPQRSYALLDQSDFRTIVDKLPSIGSVYFAQFLMTTGARFGEAIEIRLGELNTKTGEVFIGRRVVMVPARCETVNWRSLWSNLWFDCTFATE